MNKELVKMCDCPEIQGDWKPKIGDSIYLKKHFEMTTVIDDKKFTVHPTHIYIPRIEDELELLGDKIHAIVRHTDAELADMDKDDEECKRWLVDCYDSEGIAGNAYASDTLPEALIKAHMHLEHNKEWDGEAWA